VVGPYNCSTVIDSLIQSWNCCCFEYCDRGEQWYRLHSVESDIVAGTAADDNVRLSYFYEFTAIVCALKLRAISYAHRGRYTAQISSSMYISQRTWNVVRIEIMYFQHDVTREIGTSDR